MLKSISPYQEKLERLNRLIASTKNLLSSPDLARDDPSLFFQSREQLKTQEGLLRQIAGK